MNTTPRDFREVIQLLAGTHRRDWVNVIIATVTAVDIDSMTCTVRPISGDATVDDGYKIDGIQLNAEQNDGFLLLPSVDSTVIVIYPTKTTPFIGMFSDIDAMMTITAPGQQLLMGKYYDQQQSKVVDCEIQLIASSGEQVIVGKPANKQPPTGQFNSITANQGVQINGGTSPAVLGDKNYTALQDIKQALQDIATMLSTIGAADSTPAGLVGLSYPGTMTSTAVQLNILIGTINSDIQATTSTKTTLE